MNNLFSTGQNDRFEQRLRQEALASRPRFSEDLHARLREAIEHCEAPAPAAIAHPAPAEGAPRWLLATAATIALVAFSAILWQTIQHTIHQDNASHDSMVNHGANPSDPSTGLDGVSDLASQAAEHLDDLVDSETPASNWADLDQDAQLALTTLADHLPFDMSPNSP